MIKGTAAQDVFLTGTFNRKRMKAIIAGCVLVAVSLAYAVPHYAQLFTADLVLREDALRLSTVRRGELVREVVSQGRIVAANSPTLFSPEQGFVDLRVKAGESVENGQLLAVVASPDLKELLDRESSNLERMKIELERQKIQSKRRRFELQQAEDLAKVNLVAMDREQRRAEKAIERGLISELDYEEAVDNLERARLEHRQARQNNTLEQESLSFDVSTLMLQLESQQTLVNGLQRRVNGLQVTSPVEGMVGNVQVRPGQAVAANEPLITVVDLTAFEIEAMVSEGYADELAPHMEVEISLNGAVYAGELTAISPEVVGNQVVTGVRFSGTPPANLRQNQRLTARILLENKSDVLMVDRGSFVDNFDGTVFRKEGDKATRVPVVIGSRSLRHVEILGGLEEGDIVITSAVQADRSTEEILIAN